MLDVLLFIVSHETLFFHLGYFLNEIYDNINDLIINQKEVSVLLIELLLKHITYHSLLKLFPMKEIFCTQSSKKKLLRMNAARIFSILGCMGVPAFEHDWACRPSALGSLGLAGKSFELTLAYCHFGLRSLN